MSAHLTSVRLGSTPAAIKSIGHEWPDDPRVNIQNDKGMAKAYQVRQVLKAIDMLEAESGNAA